MDRPNTQMISWQARQWARSGFQKFIGRFDLDASSGLYFDWETCRQHIQAVAKTFAHVPEQLRDSSYFFNLTVSTTRAMRTASGHECAVYGAWDSPLNQISPHLEVTEASMSFSLLLPYLTHECSHLFWALQTRSSLAAYASEMIERSKGNFADVTIYAQQHFDKWQTAAQQTTASKDPRIRWALDKWLVESFCESVARMRCPWYKADENTDGQELLAFRDESIRRNFGLLIESCRDTESVLEQ